MSIAEKLTTIAENEQKVYDAGYEKGRNQSVADSDAYADGHANAQKEFWDNYQQNGERIDYVWAFGKPGWNDNIFKPRYDMKPYVANSMFCQSRITDLKSRLEECGVAIDFSTCANMNYTFQLSRITHLPKIDLSSARYTAGTFSYAPDCLKVIDELTLSQNTLLANDCFVGAGGLETVVFKGDLVRNNINLQWSPNLSVESATSLFGILHNHSGSAYEFKYELILNSAVWKKLDALGAVATNPNTNELCTWREYVTAKGWLIS